MQGEEGSYSVLQHSIYYNQLAIVFSKVHNAQNNFLDWFSLQGLKPIAFCIPHTQIDSKVNINTKIKTPCIYH
jgi:hypothetical protein